MATKPSPRVQSTRVTEEVEDDETKPRASPPRPSYQLRNNIHPHQRNPREESIVFPSSSGDESFPGAEGPKRTGKDALGKMPQLITLFIPTIRKMLIQLSRAWDKE